MRLLIYISFILFIVSCSKKELGPQCIGCEEKIENIASADVLILNEGNFGWGNASVSLYKPSFQSVSNNVYQQQNNTPLGDIAQSITQIGNNIYLVVNNSNKIEVIDINNFNSITTITGFTSPRYFLPVSNNKAYVTDLYSNSIQIVDLVSNSISGSISVDGWTENLLIYNDSVYVCDMKNNNILILDPNNNTLVDSVKVGESPNSILKDSNNKLWILCDGGINSTTPKLIKFNPANRTIEQTFLFSSITESPSDLKINANGDYLYFISSNIYKMNINDSSLPSTPFITNSGSIFYGLGINPINEDVYVSDAIDYVQNGIIFRHSNSGMLIDQFNSGIIPGKFHFIQ